VDGPLELELLKIVALVNMVMNIMFHEGRGISGATEPIAASQEIFCSWS
jgi:hypothetical protein